VRFFPPSTNHQYAGSRLSAYALGILAVLTLTAACIHSFLPDGGAGVIAGLNMGDRRDMIIGAFRWEGATQMALGLGMLTVAIRYQNLTPIFLSLVIVERGLMALEGWVLGPPADGHHPPEHYASVVAVLFAAAALALSLRRRAR
jgi:hypothetical protein